MVLSLVNKNNVNITDHHMSSIRHTLSITSVSHTNPENYVSPTFRCRNGSTAEQLINLPKDNQHWSLKQSQLSFHPRDLITRINCFSICFLALKVLTKILVCNSLYHLTKKYVTFGKLLIFSEPRILYL